MKIRWGEPNNHLISWAQEVKRERRDMQVEHEVEREETVSWNTLVYSKAGKWLQTDPRFYIQIVCVYLDVRPHLWWMISSGYCRLSKESNVKSLKVRSDGKVVAGIAHDWYCLYQPTVGLWKKRSKNLRLRSLKQWENMTINSNFQEFFGAQLIWNLNGFLLWKGSAFWGIQQFCEKFRSIKPNQQFNT